MRVKRSEKDKSNEGATIRGKGLQERLGWRPHIGHLYTDPNKCMGIILNVSSSLSLTPLLIRAGFSSLLTMMQIAEGKGTKTRFVYICFFYPWEGHFKYFIQQTLNHVHADQGRTVNSVRHVISFWRSPVTSRVYLTVQEEHEFQRFRRAGICLFGAMFTYGTVQHFLCFQGHICDCVDRVYTAMPGIW